MNPYFKPSAARLQKGQALPEYALTTVILVLAVAAILASFPNDINDWFASTIGGDGVATSFAGG